MGWSGSRGTFEWEPPQRRPCQGNQSSPTDQEGQGPGTNSTNELISMPACERESLETHTQQPAEEFSCEKLLQTVEGEHSARTLRHMLQIQLAETKRAAEWRRNPA